MTFELYKEMPKTGSTPFQGTAAQEALEKICPVAPPTSHAWRALEEQLGTHERKGKTIFVVGTDLPRPALDTFIDDIQDLPRGSHGDSAVTQELLLLLAACTATPLSRVLNFDTVESHFHSLAFQLVSSDVSAIEPCLRLTRRQDTPSDAPFWNLVSPDEKPLPIEHPSEGFPPGVGLEWTGHRGKCVADPRLRKRVVEAVLKLFTAEQADILRPALLGAEAEAETATPAEVTCRSWIFQAIPEDYDLPGALEKLPQLTWIVASQGHPRR